MKQFVLVTTSLVMLTVGTAIALTSEYTLNSFTTYVTNSGSRNYKQVTVDYTKPIMYQTSQDCRVFANTSTANWFPSVAKTPYKWQPATGVTKLLFSCYSGTVINTAQ